MTIRNSIMAATVCAVCMAAGTAWANDGLNPTLRSRLYTANTKVVVQVDFKYLTQDRMNATWRGCFSNAGWSGAASSPANAQANMIIGALSTAAAEFATFGIRSVTLVGMNDGTRYMVVPLTDERTVRAFEDREASLQLQTLAGEYGGGSTLIRVGNCGVLTESAKLPESGANPETANAVTKALAAAPAHSGVRFASVTMPELRLAGPQLAAFDKELLGWLSTMFRDATWTCGYIVPGSKPEAGLFFRMPSAASAASIMAGYRKMDGAFLDFAQKLRESEAEITRSEQTAKTAKERQSAVVARAFLEKCKAFYRFSQICSCSSFDQYVCVKLSNGSIHVITDAFFAARK